MGSVIFRVDVAFFNLALTLSGSIVLWSVTGRKCLSLSHCMDSDVGRTDRSTSAADVRPGMVTFWLHARAVCGGFE